MQGKGLTTIFRGGVVYSAYIMRGIALIIVIPYLSRLFSQDEWGFFMKCQALMSWLVLVVDFGFSLSVGRDLAIVRDNPVAVRDLVHAVNDARLLMCIVCLCIVVVLFIGNYFGENYFLPLLIFFSAITQSFTAQWYFQALEKLYVPSAIDLVGRVLFVIMNLTTINSESTINNLFMINIFANLFLFIASLFLIKDILFNYKPNFRRGIAIIKNNFSLSFFMLVTSLYSSASLLVMSFAVSPIMLAVYGNADRLVRVGLGLLTPLNQILLPKVARSFAVSFSNGLSLARKYISLYIILGLVSCFILLLFSPWVVSIFYGNGYNETVGVLRKFTLIIFLTFLNTSLLYFLLIPLRQEKTTSVIYSVSVVIFLGVCLPLSRQYGVQGMLISALIPEIIALMGMSYVIFRKLGGKNV